MFPHAHNPFDTRLSAKPDTAGFLAALGDPEAAEVYRQAMGEEASPSSPDDQGQDLMPEELARLQALEDRERGRELVELRKREYLEWAQEFGLGDDDPQGWVADTFTFYPDGTVEVDGNLDLSSKSLTRLPPTLSRVNGYLDLGNNRFTSLVGFPQEINGSLILSNNRLTSLKGLPQGVYSRLYLSYNQLTSLDELKGKKIEGDLFIRGIPAESIPKGIELGGKVVVKAGQTVLKQDAISKGYTVRVQ